MGKWQTIKQQLSDLGREAEDLTDGYLNWGGCCVFASLVANRLTELGVKVQGIVATHNGTSVTKQRPADPYHLKNWNKNGLDFNHVGLKIKLGKTSTFYDNNGFYPTKDRRGWGLELGGFPVIPGCLTNAEMEALAASDGWNRMFNRKLIPKLAKLVNETLTGKLT